MTNDMVLDELLVGLNAEGELPEIEEDEEVADAEVVASLGDEEEEKEEEEKEEEAEEEEEEEEFDEDFGVGADE